MDPNRRGWMTTEFWVTIVSLLVTILTASGIISPADREGFSSAVAQAVTSVISFLTAAGVAITYIINRTGLKKLAATQMSAMSSKSN